MQLRWTKYSRTILIALATVALCGTAVVAVIVYEPQLPAQPPPNPASFPPAQVQKGAVLAAIGDCAVCHGVPGGAPFAGGRPLATPFGTLFTSNITPDPETGIGRWSADAFRRAMTRGIARDGTLLYPALPYEHYTHVDTADLDAIYAFLMTRRPVLQTAPPNQMVFPLGFRPLLAGWNLLFLHRGPVPSDPARGAVWNRGAYLVEGLGHCGGCHTPRNLAGGEERGRAYAGGLAEGWQAPALDAANASPLPWTVETMTTYLRTGIDAEHGAAAGPMGPVTHGLSEVPEAEVRAMATYVVFLMGDRRPRTPRDRQAEAARVVPRGAVLFEGACAGCHGPGAPMLVEGRPGLALAGDLQHDEPGNTIQTMLEGLVPPLGRTGPYMPGFADAMTDEQIADLAAYLRARYTDRPAWSGLVTKVAAARKEASAP